MASSTAFATLQALLPEWQRLLQGWAADGRLTAAAQEALMLPGEPRRLRRLVRRWAAGDFSDLPPVVLLSASDMPGAMGAYAISTETIYLNQDWLLGASQEQVFAVLTEELGHHLDGVVNEGDTPGDEGEYFARLLTDELLGEIEKAELAPKAILAWQSMEGRKSTSRIRLLHPFAAIHSTYSSKDLPGRRQRRIL